jgi:hypothetical protein
MTTPLRPLSTGELLDRTFSLYRSHFGLFLGIFALPNLLVLAFQCVGVAFQSPATQLTNFFGNMLWTLAAAMLSVIAGAAAQAATVMAVSDVHLDRPATVKDSFVRVKGEISGVIGLSMLMGFLVGVGLVLLIVPGILFALMWSLAIPAKILESKGINDAMSRSSDLTRGDRARIFVIWILFILISLGVGLLLQWPITMGALASARNGLPAGSWQVAALAAGFVSKCLVGPLATIGFSLVYYDERVRKEAFDLQLMMMTLDGTPLPAPSPQFGA